MSSALVFDIHKHVLGTSCAPGASQHIEDAEVKNTKPCLPRAWAQLGLRQSNSVLECIFMWARPYWEEQVRTQGFSVSVQHTRYYLAKSRFKLCAHRGHHMITYTHLRPIQTPSPPNSRAKMTCHSDNRAAVGLLAPNSCSGIFLNPQSPSLRLCSSRSKLAAWLHHVF